MLQKKSPLILASASRARREMLENADVKFQVKPANIDEDLILKSMQAENAPPDTIALKLSQEKALTIAKDYPNHFVIGSDQILTCEGKIYQKAENTDEARKKLQTLRGKTHKLISSAAIAFNNKIIWYETDTVYLKMHNFNDKFLDDYIETAPDEILSCVGAYAFEKTGAWLFEEIDGNFFTILGMPLLPILEFLKKDETR